jgi:hypothetical protein
MEKHVVDSALCSPLVDTTAPSSIICMVLVNLPFFCLHHFCRLDDLILEAIKNLKEASVSNKAAIAAYIEVNVHQLIVFSLIQFCQFCFASLDYYFLLQLLAFLFFSVFDDVHDNLASYPFFTSLVEY